MFRPSQKINFVPGIGIHVITPQSAAAAWWLSGGISSSDVAGVWQAKGAANYAASQVNLAQPGTNDLGETNGAVAWDAVNGWKFVAANAQAFSTSIPLTKASSMIVKFSNHDTTNAGYIVMGSARSAPTVYHMMGPYYFSTKRYRLDEDGVLRQFSIAGGAASGVIGMAGQDTYLNGINNGTVPGVGYSAIFGYGPSIGALRSAIGSYGFYITAYIQSAVQYIGTITPAQMLAVSTVMP